MGIAGPPLHNMDLERITIWIAGIAALWLVRRIHVLCRDAIRHQEWETIQESGQEWIDDAPILEIPTANEKGTVSYDAEIRRAA